MFSDRNEPTEANIGRFIPKSQLLQWHKEMKQTYPQVYPPDDHLFGTEGGHQHSMGTTLKTFFDDDPNRPMKCEIVGSRWNVEFDMKEPMYVIFMENENELSQIALTSAHEEGGWQVEKVGIESDDDDSSTDDTVTVDEDISCSSSSPPKKGTRVELVGLVKKPELNGRRGFVIKEYNEETGRCGVQLDGDGKVVIAAKVSNVRLFTAEQELELALLNLKEAGGTELDPEDDNEYTDSGDSLNELLAVGDARFGLGQYDKAGSVYYRAYYITMSKSNCINNPETFLVAHKMLQAWSKSNEETNLKMGHGMAQQTLMMPGCPAYIKQDMRTIEKAMNLKGIAAEDLMNNLRSNMVNVTGSEEFSPSEFVDDIGKTHRIDPSASLEAIQDIMNNAGVNDVIELPSGTFGGGTPGESLEITKNLKLHGQGMDKTILKCNLVVKQDGCSGGKAVVRKLKVQGVVIVTDNKFDDVSFFSVEVNAGKSQANAVTINCCKKLLLWCCEIIGGSDGLCLMDRSTSARIEETDIQYAASRGIFANVNFEIKDSAVYNCGGYGIKGRVGWTDLGGNDLQPGPWSEFGPY